MKKVSVLFILFLLSLSLDFVHASIQECLSQIPKDEQKALEKYFRVLVEREGFGYTLLGSKPVSLTHWNEDYGFYQSMGCGVLESTYLRAGFKVWKKYQHLFPSKKFILLDHSFTCDNISFRELIFVNLEEFKAIKKRYPDLLNNFHLSMLMKLGKLQNPDFHLKMGLLLGYGEQNSRLFVRQCEIYSKLASLPVTPNKLPLELLEMDPGFIASLKMLEETHDQAVDQKSIILDYQAYQSVPFHNFSLYKNEQVVSCVRLPSFYADYRTDETENIYKKYSLCRKKICHLLKRECFLENVLMLFCEGQ